MSRHTTTRSTITRPATTRPGPARHRTAALATALALGLSGCGTDEVPGAASGAAPGERAAAPLAGTNVLITLIDACAADFVTPYGGDPRSTPFLARFASEGHLFEDVTAPAPYTLASVASLFTGEHVDVHGVTESDQVLPEELATLAEAFNRTGFRTLGVSTNAHVRRQSGFARGFDEFHRVRPRLGEGRPHTVPTEVLEEFEAFLDADRKSSAEPWFAYLHLMPPHAPYTAPMAARQAVGADDVDLALGTLEHLAPLTAGARVADEAETERIAALYRASLHGVDSILAEIDAALADRGITGDVLWIVLSDHGEGFGEHGLFQHSTTVYQEMLRVPLLLRLPAGARRSDPPEFLPPGTRHSEPVSTTDLFATLRELYALDVPPPLSGASLAPLLNSASGEQPFERGVPIVSRTAGPGIHRALRRGAMKIIRLPGRERPLLFDLRRDPKEQHDVARELPGRAHELSVDLERWRKLARRLRGERGTRRAAPDARTRADLEALGY